MDPLVGSSTCPGRRAVQGGGAWILGQKWVILGAKKAPKIFSHRRRGVGALAGTLWGSENCAFECLITQAATTQRYAHLQMNPLRELTERVGAVIMGAGKSGADVVTLKRKA